MKSKTKSKEPRPIKKSHSLVGQPSTRSTKKDNLINRGASERFQEALTDVKKAWGEWSDIEMKPIDDRALATRDLKGTTRKLLRELKAKIDELK
ncbi:MAG: hypothetical protein KDD25_05820 [Bdellovibrionales bacterium]|nr:hypothetical protein [Bdellovibrionales bacterium]